MEDGITSSVGANVFEAENCTAEMSSLAVYELELENELDVSKEVWRLLASGVWEDVPTCVGTTRGTCDDVLGVAIPLVVAVDLSAIFADVLGVAILLLLSKVVAVDLSAIFADVLGVAILLLLSEVVALDLSAIFADVVGITGCRGAVEEITWQFTAASILVYCIMGVKECVDTIACLYVYLYSIPVSQSLGYFDACFYSRASRLIVKRYSTLHLQ